MSAMCVCAVCVLCVCAVCVCCVCVGGGAGRGPTLEVCCTCAELGALGLEVVDAPAQGAELGHPRDTLEHYYDDHYDDDDDDKVVNHI